MQKIILTNGMFALVDNEDYNRVMEAGNWYATEHNHGVRIYAYRRFKFEPSGKFKSVLLHRFILKYNGSLDIDHDNGNGLDCQKANLNIKTRSQNMLNPANETRLDNTSGTKGVYFDTYYGSWKAEIKIQGKKFHLGMHREKDSAIAARKLAEQRIAKGLSPKESF